MKKDKALLGLMNADLARSGITEDLLEDLQFEPLPNIETKKALGIKGFKCTAATYAIPYFDHTGKKTNFCRYRLLDGSWNVEDKLGRKFKYNQKHGTLPHLYFPPIVDWPIDETTGKIKLDYLCITEGEKKAIAACLRGIPCVALGGVYSFGAKKRHIQLIDEFDLFDFTETQIEICFDSDVYSNEMVRSAMNKLASELTPLTNKPIRYVMLDSESADKTGLDDFLCQWKSKAKAEKAFWSLPRRDDKRGVAIGGFDTQVVYVVQSNRYYNVNDHRWYRSKTDVVDEFENQPKVPHPDKPEVMVSPIKVWFENRKPDTNIQSVVYMPGREQRYSVEGIQGDYINIWRPSTITPCEGQPTQWLDLIQHVFQNVSQEHLHWFMQWLAYPLQKPGTKLHQAVLVYSHAEGIGKNFIVDPFIKLAYGEKNYIRVDGSVLEDGYNGWMADKQFILIDEVKVGGKREAVHVMNQLKSYTTNHDITVNEKWAPRQTRINSSQIYMASNHSDALAVADTDRRNFIVEGPGKPLPDKFYKDVLKFAMSANGIGQVLGYLLNYDLKGFEPYGKAPFTAAKAAAVKTSQDLADYYVQLLRDNPAEVFGINGQRNEKDLYGTSEIVAAINTHANRIGIRFVCTPNSIGKYLKQNQFLNRRLTFRIKHKVCKTTLYAVFNNDKWDSADNEQWLIHMKKRDPNFAKTQVAIDREERNG